ncbi:DNA-deoxyinosine glycosylase [Mobilitalea sibirica]|uniref:DNA-deoxyinosine glycosylase n=1 Tax=Mobilitalea sibirica TaxID=1462919 RepID=A0A8J7H2I1_9FIRM|nr:DNA-deoxyinosine glycosylase [Mobilitalea sibirica]MBH1940725.1 DNA-deoxyinosine glycosylase [Mobilitalea sibirica]
MEVSIIEQNVHPFPPIYDSKSKVLILGTFPSVKSREGEFYYHHPQNRFWKVLSEICRDSLPDTIEEKKQLLLRNGIAVWDVIKSCEITGSADSSIKNVTVNDLEDILSYAEIRQIYANGSKAYQLYMKYIYPEIKREIIKLPSTSPANASYSLEKLIEFWSCILI